MPSGDYHRGHADGLAQGRNEPRLSDIFPPNTNAGGDGQGWGRGCLVLLVIGFAVAGALALAQASIDYLVIAFFAIWLLYMGWQLRKAHQLRGFGAGRFGWILVALGVVTILWGSLYYVWGHSYEYGRESALVFTTLGSIMAWMGTRVVRWRAAH